MDLRDLELFCEVARLRSFSQAAKALGVSQPVASETVKAIEKRFGHELICRDKRPLELTPSGKIYYEGCRELLEGYRRLEDRVLQVRDKVTGPVRVASIYSVGLLQMDCYVKQFEHLYPDAALELRYLHPEAVLDRVISDEADLGLISFPPKRAELTCIPWQEQEIVVVVPPQHRLGARKSLVAAELDGESLVAFTHELQIRAEMDRWLRHAKVSVDVVHEFDNIETIKRAVEIGSGIALLPISTVRREMEIGSLRMLKLEDVRWVRPLGIIHKRHNTLTTAVQRFLELLHEPPESFFRPKVVQSTPRKAATVATANT
ncbi:MAG TPA: LysR family transcriptional regulator [Planctomycetaceae bacterium]|nr:LysR family transcriptional regulator [Planctomycetaceae bacterium]